MVASLPPRASEPGIVSADYRQFRLSAQFYLLAIIFAIVDVQAVFRPAWAVAFAPPTEFFCGSLTLRGFGFMIFDRRFKTLAGLVSNLDSRD
nr:NADH-quinone oxidoreductase subunit A [Gammaproteobacteria bacterium]